MKLKQGEGICYKLASFLILSRVKAALGFDECDRFTTGAAPIKKSTLDYFASLGMPVLGAFGMSETSAVATN